MLTVKAPAKINWSLFVLDKREDGYHNILSLMQCIGLYDVLEFELSDDLVLSSSLDLPYEQNLVFKAASLLRRHAGVARGAKIHLQKEIPSGAGLGGGSSDAAYTLMALNDLWQTGLGNDELKNLGSALGSDVAFFFEGPLAAAEGRGEILTGLPVARSYTLLLVKPECSVSTSWAYGSIDKEAECPAGPGTARNEIDSIQSVYRALAEGDIAKLAATAHNDFEKPVMERYLEIGGIKEQLLKNGAAMALMTGSGSAVYGLFEDEREAMNASGLFPSCFCRVVKTLV